jgi:hypothetical protein
MANNITVTIVGAVQSVPVADTPATIIVKLTGQADQSINIAGPYAVTFNGVADGTYEGSIQSARADGSLIGQAITFSVVVNADQVQAFVPQNVTVSVVAA